MNLYHLQLAQPEDVVNTFITAWNERNADKLASIFVENAEFVNVTGLWWHDRERIFKAHDYGLKVIFNHSNLKAIRTKVRYLSDEIAIVHCKMRITDQSAHEQESSPLPRRNILIFVVQKGGEGWVCHAVQNTEIQNGKETFVIGKDGKASAVNYGSFDNYDQ